MDISPCYILWDKRFHIHTHNHINGSGWCIIALWSWWCTFFDFVSTVLDFIWCHLQAFKCQIRIRIIFLSYTEIHNKKCHYDSNIIAELNCTVLITLMRITSKLLQLEKNPKCSVQGLHRKHRKSVFHRDIPAKCLCSFFRNCLFHTHMLWASIYFICPHSFIATFACS